MKPITTVNYTDTYTVFRVRVLYVKYLHKNL